MDQQIKSLWTAALRSGKYKQGKGSLYLPYTNTYCCLGVLCKVYEEVTGNLIDFELMKSGTGVIKMVNLLPAEIIEWAGGDVSIGEYNQDNNLTLAQINDNGTPFNKIADIIEERY